MLYCLPLKVHSNMKEQSDEIFESTILSSLICIPILYDILELILKLILNENKKIFSYDLGTKSYVKIG